MKNDFVLHDSEDSNAGVSKAKNHLFDGKSILEIGGVYKNRYAIVKE